MINYLIQILLQLVVIIFQVSKISTMEADCQDNKSSLTTTTQETIPDLNKLLSVITSHITEATTKI
jgi:hypothetical protein